MNIDIQSISRVKSQNSGNIVYNGRVAIVEGQQYIVQLVGSKSTEQMLNEIASDMQYKGQELDVWNLGYGNRCKSGT